METSKLKRDIEFGETMGGFPISNLKENPIQPTKLYSEILNLVEEAEYEEIPNSAIYKMDFEKAAQSIEHLLYDKLEGFGKWILIEGYEPKTDGKVKWFGKGDKVYHLNEIIEKYLNK